MIKSIRINNQKIARMSAAYLAVAIMFMGFPLSVFAAPSADIKINGSDGPVTIVNGESWSYSWVSGDATACQLTSPSGVSGISLAGNDDPINSDHPWYPAVGSSTTLTLDCTDGTDSTSDSVTVNVIAGDDEESDITADIKANGSDGPVTITNGQSWSYSWVSNNATACQLTSPSGVSGISLAGNDGPINPDHPWYPAVGSSTTLTLDCTDGTDTVSDSVVINVVSGGGGGPNPVDADIKANGSDGPVTVINGDSWVYSWTSNNATACQLTSPSGVSGISLAGNDGPINPGHPWYPAVGSSTTLTLDCTNGTNTDSDSVTINVVARSTGGGGGGGGGGGRGSTIPGTVTGPATAEVCPWLNSYLRIGANNDMIQVMKLQAFLIHFEGYTNVQITGIFDQATHEAVKAFQLKYKRDILDPWGISEPTGYVYVRTLAKINQIVCGTPMPPAPVKTVPPKVIKDIKKPCPCPCECPPCPTTSKEGASKEGYASTTASNIEIIGDSSPGKGGGLDKGKSIAAALFAIPQTKGDFMNTLYGFLLILIVLYIIGSVLENVLYDNKPENVRKRFMSKWIAISIGLAVAIIAAYLLGRLTLILPLLIVLVLTLVWLFTYSSHNSLRASLKAWNLVIAARAKTILNKAKEEDSNTTTEVVAVEKK